MGEHSEEENSGNEMMVRSDFLFDCLTAWHCPASQKDKRQNFKLFTFCDSWWQGYRRDDSRETATFPSSLVECVCVCMHVCLCL